ncbi:MAG: hypothetical protein H6868_07930 [Rhodospirillales bacterium]|nr:hypothetical protein [Rhodospirillales bacterium]
MGGRKPQQPGIKVGAFTSQLDELNGLTNEEINDKIQELKENSLSRPIAENLEKLADEKFDGDWTAFVRFANEHKDDRNFTKIPINDIDKIGEFIDENDGGKDVANSVNRKSGNDVTMRQETVIIDHTDDKLGPTRSTINVEVAYNTASGHTLDDKQKLAESAIKSQTPEKIDRGTDAESGVTDYLGTETEIPGAEQLAANILTDPAYSMGNGNLLAQAGLDTGNITRINAKTGLEQRNEPVEQTMTIQAAAPAAPTPGLA